VIGERKRSGEVYFEPREEHVVVLTVGSLARTGGALAAAWRGAHLIALLERRPKQEGSCATQYLAYLARREINRWVKTTMED